MVLAHIAVSLEDMGSAVWTWQAEAPAPQRKESALGAVEGSRNVVWLRGLPHITLSPDIES
jgi:hypothetical protein